MTSAPIELRLATSADAGGIAQVNVASWRAAYQRIVPDAVLAALSLEERGERWERLLAGGGGALVTEVRGTIVGYVAFGPDHGREPATGEVYALYVDPDSWSGGIGTALLAGALERLVTSGYTRAVLWALADNARGRRFFEAAGFAADGEERPWEAGNVTLTELRYARDLAIVLP